MCVFLFLKLFSLCVISVLVSHPITSASLSMNNVYPAFASVSGSESKSDFLHQLSSVLQERKRKCFFQIIFAFK